MQQICQSRFNILPNSKKETFKILPKWPNFAKSGHTVPVIKKERPLNLIGIKVI